LRQYVSHYNAERPHRSLALTAPLGASHRATRSPPSRVWRRDVLGGLIHDYHQAA
jgi:hypothetical protein